MPFHLHANLKYKNKVSKMLHFDCFTFMYFILISYFVFFLFFYILITIIIHCYLI